MNLGTDDQGAMFDFDFGTILPGQTKTFESSYGAAPNESTALGAALQAVGAQIYSLGQPRTLVTPTCLGPKYADCE